MTMGFSLSRVFAMLGKEFIQMRRDRMTLEHADRHSFDAAILVRLRHQHRCPSIWRRWFPFPIRPVFRFDRRRNFELGLFRRCRRRRTRLSSPAVCWPTAKPPSPSISRSIFRAIWCAARALRSWWKPMRRIPRRALMRSPRYRARQCGAARRSGWAFGGARDGRPSFNVVVHNLYNPENITQYNIVPGLLGVILTMTMVMATSIALTRERERGTYENLLAMPTRPVEIMLGKITPNIFVGAFQCA